MKTHCTIAAVTIMLALAVALTPCSAQSRAYLGVHLSNIATKSYEEFGLEKNYGILVSDVVEDGPSAKAGMKAKDIILEFDGNKIYTYDQLVKMLELYEPEKSVKVKVFRDGKEKKLTVTLGEKKSLFSRPCLGVLLEGLTEKDFEKMGLKERYGVLIDDTVDDGPAEKAGIREDDVLLEIEDEKIYSTDQIIKMLKNYKIGQTVKVKVAREGDYRTFDVVLEEREDIFPFMDMSGLNLLNIPRNVFVYKTSEKDGKWIGIIPTELNDMLRESHDVKNGVFIKKVFQDSPAEKAGLLGGDIILKMDGKKIEESKDLRKIIQEKELDETIEVEIKRGKDMQVIKVGVAERDDRIEVVLDTDDIEITVGGEEKILMDLEDKLKGLEKLKQLKKLQWIEGNELKELDMDLEHLEQELQELDGEMKQLDIEMKLKQNGGGNII
jgi:S1-C subfamily serine protease